MPPAKRLHKYAAVISARNESTVIGELIHSIKKQNYPAELLDVFVVADNCTDNTAAVARRAGAIVFERFNRKEVGKGYALDYAFQRIEKDYAAAGYEGYFIFDADNLLDANYVAEMNKAFDSGCRVITSYRNSKNYDSNWISAGQRALVPARSQVPEQFPHDPGDQLRGIWYRFPGRKRCHPCAWRVEVPPAHRGHPVLYRLRL